MTKFYLRSPLMMMAMISGLVLALQGTARAWTRSGHMVTAAIAYHDLGGAASPVVQRIVDIMEGHPEPGPFLVAVGRATGIERTQRVFLEIPRWADDIRGSEYDHPTWHYLVRPVVDPRNPPPQGAPYAYSGNAAEALALSIEMARNPRASRAERAIALCWIFHIVGDIHQPLHTAEYFSEEMPQGDFAGDKFYLIDPKTREPIKLHRFWDDLGSQSEAPEDALRRGEQLLGLYPRARFTAELNRDKTRPADLRAWAAESYVIAVDMGYRADRPNAISPDRATLPSEKYIADSTAVAEPRLTFAGYRLAEVLRAIFD